MTSPAIGFLCFVVVFAGAQAANLPSYIKACKVRAPDFRECAVKSGNSVVPMLANGDKKLGIPTFNPLKLPFIEFASGAFKLNGSDVIVTGLPNIKVNDFQVDLKTKNILLNVTCPEIKLDLDYNIGGKVVALPLEGHGKGIVIINEPVIVYDLSFDEEDRKGNKHLVIKKDHLDIFPTKITFKLDNLFQGNKALGDSTNQLLNENWSEVLKEFRPAITEIVTSVIRSILNPIINKVPINEIFPDY